MRRLSELEKVEIWDQFEAGESQRSISRRLGRSPSSIRRLDLACQPSWLSDLSARMQPRCFRAATAT